MKEIVENLLDRLSDIPDYDEVTAASIILCLILIGTFLYILMRLIEDERT